ncbi:MAG: BatA domain-containing protein [Pirellulales bacterium]|nr:BatA domain-containing protein [Pirellulales bacterium]
MPYAVWILFALGWTDPPMLGWLAAAAAPILIHLFSRRRRRETGWAAMELLRAAVQKRSRRMRFERWLLPAVRAMLIAIVAAAAAGPYLGSTSTASSPGRGTHRILLFDCSYSMSYKPADRARFDLAKERARLIVEASFSGDAFSLAAMSRRPRTVLSASLDREAALRAIDDMRPSEQPAELPPTVAVLRRIIDDAKKKHPLLERTEIYVLSDLQRTTWSPELSPSARAEFIDAVKALAESASLRIVDVGGPGADNLAVVDLRPLDPPVLTRRPATLRVELKNFGENKIAKQNVDLLIDGRAIDRKKIDLPPGESVEVVFSHAFDAPGEKSIEVAAMGDRLEIDNRRYCVLSVRGEINVLCVDGRPSGKRLDGTADYVALALDVREPPAGDAKFNVETADESALVERDLNEFDCLFLCNVARFTDAEVRALAAYLQRGGGVIFFLGDQVQAENYNRLLCTPGQGGAGGMKILPARLGRLIERRRFRLDPLGFQHPILKTFRGRGQNVLTATPVFKYFNLELPEDAETNVVLAAAGDPLIVERPMGQGRVVLAATAAEPDFSPLPLWPSFVPLVREMADYCAAGRTRRQNIMVGDRLEMFVAPAAAEASAKLVAPDKQVHRLRPQSLGDRALLSYGDAIESGLYLVKFGSSTEDERPFAVNLDTSESDLARIEPAELRTETWPDVGFQYRTHQQRFDAAIGSERAGGGLHAFMLCCALGLLLSDTLLSWKYGRK